MRRMLNNMTELLHRMGALVLVEGIETNDELMITLDADVDLAQGFLLGRPQDAAHAAFHADVRWMDCGERLHRLANTLSVLWPIA